MATRGFDRKSKTARLGCISERPFSLFSTIRRVEFRDTDAAGIVHFSAFFPMMESAEHEMVRSLGFSVMPDRNSDALQSVTWPRVSAKCDYVAAAHFEDELRIDVSVARIGNSSVQYEFQFGRVDQLHPAGGTHPIAKGIIVAVCCQLDDTGLTKVSIPDSIREKLQLHLASPSS